MHPVSAAREPGSARRQPHDIAHPLSKRVPTASQRRSLTPTWGPTPVTRDSEEECIRSLFPGPCRPVCLLLKDVGRHSAGMLDDVTHLLSSGQLPGLFKAEELTAIVGSMRPVAKTAGLRWNEHDRSGACCCACRSECLPVLGGGLCVAADREDQTRTEPLGLQVQLLWGVTCEWGNSMCSAALT